MKFYAGLILLCFGLGYSQADLTKEELLETFKILSQKCKDETAASDDDVDIMMKHEMDKTQEGKCLRACMMTKYEVMNADKMLVKEKMLKITDFMLKSDPEKVKLANEIIESCESITDDDKCEAAYKIAKCLHDAATEKGVVVEW